MYEVVWSVPTPAYPEPQVTVSVYFYIEASKVKPSSFPVDVSLCFCLLILSVFNNNPVKKNNSLN